MIYLCCIIYKISIIYQWFLRVVHVLDNKYKIWLLVFKLMFRESQKNRNRKWSETKLMFNIRNVNIKMKKILNNQPWQRFIFSHCPLVSSNLFFLNGF
jgi:hypothetical protein